MNLLKYILYVFMFVAFVAGATYVTLHRADDMGWLSIARSGAEVADVEQDADHEPYEEAAFPFIVPVDGPEVTPAELAFSFHGTDFTVQAEVDSRVYHGAVSARRGFLLATDATAAQRLGAIEAYYNKLAFDPEMDSAIESVLIELRVIRDSLELDDDEYVDMLARFVQSIGYDENRGYVDVGGHSAKALGDPRMPVQVLVDGLGDCDEKVILLAALLNREGFATAALYFEEEQHMSLGIRASGEGFAGTGYDFIETTGLTYVSEVPTEFIGGIVLRNDPEVLVFDPSTLRDDMQRGERGYSVEAVQQVARIIHVRDTAEEASREQREFIESTPMNEIDFERENSRFEACFFALNSFRATVDNLGRDTGDFMDRTKAIEWIERNAWWEEESAP